MADATAKAAHLLSFYPDDFVPPYKSSFFNKIRNAGKASARAQPAAPTRPETPPPTRILESDAQKDDDQCFADLLSDETTFTHKVPTLTDQRNFVATVNYEASIDCYVSVEGQLVVKFGGCLKNDRLTVPPRGRYVKPVPLRDDVSLLASLLREEVPKFTFVAERVDRFNHAAELEIDKTRPFIHVQFTGTGKSNVFFFPESGNYEEDLVRLPFKKSFTIAPPIEEAELF